MTWKSVNFNSLVPQEVTAVATQGVSLIDQYLDAARAVVSMTKAFRGRLSLNTDVLGATVKALVDTLEGFLQLGKVHTLFIPMAKAIPDNAGAVGGNERFYRVFAEALNDDLDPNRPQYTEGSDAVVMSVAMAGAPTFTEAIEIAASLNRIFRPSSNNDLSANAIPVPQNVKAKPIAHPAAKRIAVRLDWDSPKETFAFPHFPGINVAVKRYAIIRSTSPTLLNARSVVDLFGTRDLKEGTTSTDKAKVHKVLAVGTGTNSTYIDKDDGLNPTTSYYYTIAWETAVNERGKTTVVKFDKLSNVVKTRVRTVAVTEAAVPPNWAALPSLAQLVPSLADATFLLVEQLNALSNRSFGPQQGLSKALDMMEQRVDRLIQEMDSINTAFKQLSAVIGQPLPRIHGITFYGVGGNDFLLSQLQQALDNASDINRPPFDNNEYVVGVCIVAGGPRIPDIQPIIDFLTSVFGARDTAKNTLGNILNILEGAIAGIENVVFGPSMNPLPVNPDGSVMLPDGTSAAPSLINPATGVPYAGDLPVVGTDGTMIETENPSNPQAGQTYVTPLSELC